MWPVCKPSQEGPVLAVLNELQHAPAQRAVLADLADEKKQLATFFFAKFANFWRARSRLYQNEILQENMRLTSLFKLYKMCIFLHRCNLKIFAKNGFAKSAIFAECQQNF